MDASPPGPRVNRPNTVGGAHKGPKRRSTRAYLRAMEYFARFFQGQLGPDHIRQYQGHCRDRRDVTENVGPLVPGDVLAGVVRSEEHTSELQSLRHLVC